MARLARYIDAEKTLIDAWNALYQEEDEREAKVLQGRNETEIENWFLEERRILQDGFELCQKAIVNAPTSDVVERKTGKWITMSDADGVYWSCSECGEDIPRIAHYNPQFDLFPRLETIDKTNFCPHCGARMEIE